MEELKKIKKIYGEKFMQMCRTLFPTILETEGKLYETLNLYFSNNSKTLYYDIVENNLEYEFKRFIYSKIKPQKEDVEDIIVEEKTPYELLDEAGYELIECKSEREIQDFKKYYKTGEELCTFAGGRLNRCYVFFAVRKDVKNIKREDFDAPKREDEYGTSVMGIQFNKKGPCSVSIKNRYNHTVHNPDATYGNNLDRIIPGLTQSFGRLLKERGLELNTNNIEEFEIPSYCVANDGKFYKFNMEINGTFYCPGNIIIKNGEVHKIKNPEKHVLIDYFILDLENKKIQLYDENIKDSFIDGLHDIEKIEIVKNKEKQTKIITIRKKGQEEPIIIEIDEDNQIVRYEDSNLTCVGNNFLRYNEKITQLNMPNVTSIGDVFLACNRELTQLELPKVKKVGDVFLSQGSSLKQLKMPELIEAGKWFLAYNEELTQLELPKVKKVGDYFLSQGSSLKQLKMPELIEAGDDFLVFNSELTQLELPKVKKVGNNFLSQGRSLKQLKMPELIETGDWFLACNKDLKQIDIPNLTSVGDHFLANNEELTQLELPKVKKVGCRFLANGKSLKQLKMPELIEAGDMFLRYNKELMLLEMPYIRGATERLATIMMKNKVKSILKKPKITESVQGEEQNRMSSEATMLVNENKLAQIYAKAKGRVKNVFETMKAFVKEKSSREEDKGDIDEKE